MRHWFTPLTTGLLLTACTKEVVVLKDAPPPPPPQPGRWADVFHTARGELADPATSVDGVHMVYSEQQQPGESALYVQRLDRGRDAARVALAPAPGEDRMPTYGPNGTWVYFSSNRWGSWDILRTRADGTGPIEQVTHDDIIDEFEPSVSPDGEWMAYARSVPGSTDGYRIWIRNLVDGRDIDLQTPGRHPAWDPAGNRIAFQHRPQADGPLWSIFTLEVDTLGRTGALAQVVAPTDDGYGAIAPSWSPDGLNLAFLRARNAGGPLSGIWTVAAEGGRPVEIHVDQADSFWSMAWGFDQRIHAAGRRAGEAGLHAFSEPQGNSSITLGKDAEASK
ncbi:MAG: hypothetical protein VXW23_01935 [Planctomycetota bacterium]|nr:hypothetical protein [Planctomycetota bacterium]